MKYATNVIRNKQQTDRVAIKQRNGGALRMAQRNDGEDRVMMKSVQRANFL